MDDSQSAGRKPKRFFSDEFKRDAVRLIVEEKYTFRVAADTLGVRDRTHRLIDSQEQVGGWPVLRSETAPLDTDQDGMPDAWEAECGLDPANAEDRNGDQDRDGYTNLEAYLNSLCPAEPPAGEESAP